MNGNVSVKMYTYEGILILWGVERVGTKFFERKAMDIFPLPLWFRSCL